MLPAHPHPTQPERMTMRLYPCRKCTRLQTEVEYGITDKGNRRRICITCGNGQRRYNQQDPATLLLTRGYNLKHRFGFGNDGYEDRLRAQGGVCLLCGSLPEKGKYLTVDHDRRCCPTVKSCGSCVRGLLCRQCNTAVGMIECKAIPLDKLQAYLER